MGKGLLGANVGHAFEYRVHIEWALSHPGRCGKPITCHAAAGKLNEQRLPSPMGGRWTSVNVADIAYRLKLRDRPVRVPHEVLQARVRAVWTRHPDFTARQVMASAGPDSSVCIGTRSGSPAIEHFGGFCKSIGVFC